MPVTGWADVAGKTCDQCQVNPATHLYGSILLCCQCHTGDPEGGLFSPEEARVAHEAHTSPRTRVVNLRHESYDVYIGRGKLGGKDQGWGNPFVIGPDGTREAVVAKHRAWFLSEPDLVEKARRELKGKRLGCFCKQTNCEVVCHGDILAVVTTWPDNYRDYGPSPLLGFYEVWRQEQDSKGEGNG